MPFSRMIGGGSVTGRIQWAVPFSRMIGVMGVSTDGKTIRKTHCDQDGNLCLPYLTPGSWELFAQDDAAGWCRIGPVVVKNDAADCGVHKLQSGASVTGRVTSGTVELTKCTVVAVDARGIVVEALDAPDAKQEFRIGNLWPGRWSVKLMRGKKPLATAAVDLAGTEHVRCNLAAQ